MDSVLLQASRIYFIISSQYFPFYFLCCYSCSHFFSLSPSPPSPTGNSGFLNDQVALKKNCIFLPCYLSLYIYILLVLLFYILWGFFFLLWLFFLSHWIFYIKSYVLLEHILVLWVSFLLLRKYYYKCILAYHLFKFLKSIFFLVNLFPLVSVFKIYFGLGVSCCYLFSYAKRSSVFI